MWILRYIFPNGYLPKITELAAPCRDLFVMEDLHSFGRDYDLTLLSGRPILNVVGRRSAAAMTSAFTAAGGSIC